MGQATILTNGCFDIITVAHVRVIQYASLLRGQFGKLIVAVNDDASVAYLKGPMRPINTCSLRMEVVSALKGVDQVVSFNEPTITHLIHKFRPTHWVKGGDYTLDKLNAEEVNAANDVGCKIVLIPRVDGVSTTEIVERLKEHAWPDHG